MEINKKIYYYDEVVQLNKDLEEKNNYNKVTQRILINILNIISSTLKINNFKIYIDDFNQSLKLLFIFPDAIFKEHENEIYKILPSIQEYVIEHEGVDFTWSLMSDKYVNLEMVDSEYPHYLNFKA